VRGGDRRGGPGRGFNGLSLHEGRSLFQLPFNARGKNSSATFPSGGSNAVPLLTTLG
jgi:hypothetical protein